MGISAGAASEKISELKSKLAVYAELQAVIRANYLPSDGGAPELRIPRSDGTSCSPAHIEAVVDELDDKIAEAKTELIEWEGLTFEKRDAGAEVRRIATNDEPKQRAERKPHGRRFGPAAASKP